MGIFCQSCGHAHNDPRLRDPAAEVSIDFNGSQRVCMIYAKWIAEAILAGRDVHLRRLGPEDANVIIEGYAPLPSKQ